MKTIKFRVIFRGKIWGYVKCEKGLWSAYSIETDTDRKGNILRWSPSVPNVLAHGGEVIYEQFTGHLDNNGREIYENDIVYYNDGSDDDKAEVTFVDGMFKFNWRHDSYSGNGYRDDCEVIGRINEVVDEEKVKEAKKIIKKLTHTKF